MIDDQDKIKDSQKIIFLNHAKRLSEEYGLRINWENFDYDRGLIEFLGDVEPDVLCGFIEKLSDFGEIC